MSGSRRSVKQRIQLLKKMAKRLSAYSTVAAATVASLNSTVNAAEVRWDIPDVLVGNLPGIMFNMENGESVAATNIYNNSTSGFIRLVGYYSSLYPNPYIYTPASSTKGAFVGSGSNVARLSVSAIIGASQTFGAYPSAGLGNYGNLGNWALGESGYIGIRFDLSGDTHYGWAEVSRLVNLTITIHSFGYNDTPDAASTPKEDDSLIGDINLDGKVDDADLNLLLSSFDNPPSEENQTDLEGLLENFGAVKESATTPVPEPSSIMLLAAGAAGLVGWRRRRSCKAA